MYPREISENLHYFGESAVQKFSSAGCRRGTAILFLHGFPADSGKNEDIALRLALNLQVDTFVFHYPGLGKSLGHFSFRLAISEAERFVQYLAHNLNYSKIHIVGHSFGGYVAINLLQDNGSNFGRVVLLAPPSSFPDYETIDVIVSDFIARQLHTFGRSYDAHELTSDFTAMAHGNSPLQLASKIRVPPGQILVIQGSQDEVVVPTEAVLLATAIQDTARLINVADDHWFRNRNQLYKIVEDWISKGTVLGFR